MKLNIYDKRKIVKTYEAKAYDLEFGLLEDIAELAQLDKLKTGSDTEIINLALNLVVKSTGTVKELMCDIFDGLTAEELRHVKIKEMGAVIIELLNYTISEITNSFTSKN